MSTVVANPTAAPLAASHVERDPSPKSYPPLAPSTSNVANISTPSRVSTASNDGSAGKVTPPEGKRSPNFPRSGGSAPRIVVKKEPPSSPSLQSGARHRPRKLDLSASLPSNNGGLTARPPGGAMTAREPGMGIQDVGLACLSPGFQTQDPTMREQLQRSISVRDQQRSIIESRLQKSAKGDGPDGSKASDSNLFGSTKPGSSKKKPPPGLSIVPPSASQFAHERVIQSAPLNQTFTGRHQAPSVTRHVSHQASNMAASSHVHHAPANQTSNRLPPIADVFGSDALGSRDRENRNGYYQNSSGTNSSQSNNLPPLPSPGLPGNNQPLSARPREYRSAEEAVHELAGGREDLLPRIVHYGGHQPPTPPSPQVNNTHPPHSAHPAIGSGAHRLGSHAQSSGPGPAVASGPITSRRRPRNEYERDNGSPPLGTGPDSRYRGPSGLAPGVAPPSAAYGPFGAGRESPEAQRRKKEEFLGLCARAWDLFHS